MALNDILAQLSSKSLEVTRKLGSVFVRGLAVVAIIGTYGLGQVASVMGVSGVVMTASTTPAQAWRGGWGRGGWGRGGWGRGGWGWGGGRGCRGWRGGRCWWWW